MKTLLNIGCVLCLFLMGYASNAQEKVIGNVNMAHSLEHIGLNINNLKSTTLTSVDLTSKELVGSMYINNDFFPGRIDAQENTYSFRYNAFLDEMEVQFGEANYFMPLAAYYTITFVGTNKKYEVLDKQSEADTKKGFFVVLLKGEPMSLYKKENIKFYEEVPAKLGFTKYEPPKLQRTKDSFFVRFEGNEVIEIPQKKKEALKVFSKKGSSMTSYIKKRKLSFKKEEDVIQMVRYYNSLFVDKRKSS